MNYATQDQSLARLHFRNGSSLALPVAMHKSSLTFHYLKVFPDEPSDQTV